MAFPDQTSAALYFIGGVRVTFSTGIAAGGNLAYWYAVAHAGMRICL